MSNVNDKINVGIYVFGDRVAPRYHGYVESEIGKAFSTDTKINVNKTVLGYSILFTDSTFMELDARVLARNIVSLFVNKLPGKTITFSICYSYHVMVNGKEYTLFDADVAEQVIELNNIMIALVGVANKGNLDTIIEYHISKSMEMTAKDLRESLEYGEPEYEPDDTDDASDDGDDFEDPFEVLGISLDNYHGKRSNDYKRKKKKSKKTYGESKAIKESNDPKKYYKRHGVIVCKDKDAIRRDEKIIKEFLKDFIPGNSEWKKDFRSDVLKRWMDMYVITSKRLKYLEKHHRKHQSKKYKKQIDTNKALDITRRIFNQSTDIWNDPTR